MAKVRIDDLEEALIAAVKADPTIRGYVREASIATLSAETLDLARQQIIILPPAILVLYLGGDYTRKEILLKNYAAGYRFELVTVSRNLRSAAEAKRGTATTVGAYDMLEDLKTALAGKKLTLANGSSCVLELVADGFRDLQNANWIYALEVITRAATWDNAG